MATQTELQYISNAAGQLLAVIVPIEVWREIESEPAIANLLKSDPHPERKTCFAT